MRAELARAYGRTDGQATERTAAELAAMQPDDVDRRRGRTRRRIEDVLARRALARELGDSPDLSDQVRLRYRYRYRYTASAI